MYISPLRVYPGPWYARASIIPYIYWLATGELVHASQRTHEKYGPTVRLAPNKLSFTQSQAWFDIHGHRTQKRMRWFDKDPSVYLRRYNGVPSIVDADEQDHARFRRLLANAFSEKALRDQEPILQQYVNLLISQLHKTLDGPQGGVVDLAKWINFTTFDIIGDLTFGHSFDCLESGEEHPWISLLPGAARTMTYLLAFKHFPTIVYDTGLILIKPFLSQRRQHAEFTIDQVNIRLTQETDRKDFITPILKANDEKGMTNPELQSSINLLITAGSETLATLLSGATYYLSCNKPVLKKLQEEVRSTFKSAEEVTMTSCQTLPYLHAVLEESLRIYPPASLALGRIVPHGGSVINGKTVPAGTGVGISAWAASHSKHNFVDPDAFVPERWLGDERFEKDDKQASQPFSVGGRNCVGKNLAYAEMRLILTRLVLDFDFAIQEGSQYWIRQKLFTFWEKPPLLIKISRAKC
ncbi:putative toxin biosynthesis cytochrome p450 protein [Botrytis fragariae]|uniref:Putative toxin biosynthesis cytochrome p450 protein n=1 Tax=Botrytis fragariae TaxID=1964551 RepID=A0A8H6AY82_9HELO|nr:putative toxin biosynthesis cytochrome p450 protein [Botrytis fragariae]KAF5875949.1 putative toxin biosynthesis cytochrome p450 protein [Botrytis fragariae]